MLGPSGETFKLPKQCCDILNRVFATSMQWEHCLALSQTMLSCRLGLDAQKLPISVSSAVEDTESTASRPLFSHSDDDPSDGFTPVGRLSANGMHVASTARAVQSALGSLAKHVFSV